MTDTLPTPVTVDLPASAFWPELAAASPEALVILSVRDSAGQWWDSFSQTIASADGPPALPPGIPQAGFAEMITGVLAGRLGITDVTDKAAMISGYERHNNTVRATAPPGRLLEWRPSDGWPPIAAALGLPTPICRSLRPTPARSSGRGSWPAAQHGASPLTWPRHGGSPQAEPGRHRRIDHGGYRG